MMVNESTLNHEYCHGAGLVQQALIRWQAVAMAADLTPFLKWTRYFYSAT